MKIEQKREEMRNWVNNQPWYKRKTPLNSQNTPVDGLKEYERLTGRKYESEAPKGK